MKKKGFTLIELLAVIVILGLLMAIAIPSVTKYITQSRKKTVTTTIGNYISALTNQVNDMEYIFTETNTVYAVPIECIALERGGTNPFGKWHQASEAYWAYVLVQYDDATSSYTYGFTFKDSAGYGLYPTTTEKLNESGSQIQTGLNLNRPTGDLITNITPKANWTGFNLEDDTKLVVLEATSEGETGDGKTTCTLCQKGDNYDEVENTKEKICNANGSAIGDVVTCGSESFYIIENNNNNIFMLAKSKINLDLNNPIQNESAGEIRFSESMYWFDSVNQVMYSQYGNKRPASVYDSNSDLYKYVEAYKSYLEKLGLSIIEAKLISYDQLLNLGCVEPEEPIPFSWGDGYSCQNAPSWINPGYKWQTGIFTKDTGYWWHDSDPIYANYTTIKSGVRPVIVISKSEIDFN